MSETKGGKFGEEGWTPNPTTIGIPGGAHTVVRTDSSFARYDQVLRTCASPLYGYELTPSRDGKNRTSDLFIISETL